MCAYFQRDVYARVSDRHVGERCKFGDHLHYYAKSDRYDYEYGYGDGNEQHQYDQQFVECNYDCGDDDANIPADRNECWHGYWHGDESGGPESGD